MGKLVSNSFSLPRPLSTSRAAVLVFPKPCGETVSSIDARGAHGLAVARGPLVGEGSAGENERRVGEKERRPSMGGGERARLVSGDWSW